MWRDVKSVGKADNLTASLSHQLRHVAFKQLRRSAIVQQSLQPLTLHLVQRSLNTTAASH